MADNTCRDELNRQLQAMEKRLKSVEDNLSQTMENQWNDIMSTLMGFAALIETGGIGGLPAFIANPVILRFVQAIIGDVCSGMGTMSTGSEITAIQDALSEMTSSIQEIWASLLAGGSMAGMVIDWRKMMLQLAISAISNAIPSFGAEFIGNVESLAAALVAANAALAADPLNPALQAAVANAQAALDAMETSNSACESQNRLDLCKIASSRLGIV